jgi:hypothetical protein
MRCICCNKLLTDFECSRKSITTGDYLDMCSECYKHIKDDVTVIENNDLLHIQDVINVEDVYDINREE